MGPGAPSAATPCGFTGGSAQSAAGAYGFNSEAGSARYRPMAGGVGSLRGLSRPLSCSRPLARFRLLPGFLCGLSALVSAPALVRTLSKIAARKGGKRSRAGAASTKAPGAGGQNKRPEGPRRPPGRRPPAPKPRSGRARGDPAGPREAQRGGRDEASPTEQGGRSEAKPTPSAAGPASARGAAQRRTRAERGSRGEGPRAGPGNRAKRGRAPCAGPGPRSGGRAGRAGADPRRGRGPGATGDAECAKSGGGREAAARDERPRSRPAHR